MLHELRFLGQYVIITLRGLVRIYTELVKWGFRIIKNMPWQEQLFFVMAGGELLLMLPKWKSYEFMAAGKFLIHGIYSDDFVYFLLFNGLLFFGVFRYVPEFLRFERFKIFWVSLRFFSLSIMTLFYLLNLFSSGRIALAPEAEFTLWFFLYGFVLVLLWVIGILGIGAMPRIREDGLLPSGRVHR